MTKSGDVSNDYNIGNPFIEAAVGLPFYAEKFTNR
jgi:hypothetical protein